MQQTFRQFVAILNLRRSILVKFIAILSQFLIFISCDPSLCSSGDTYNKNELFFISIATEFWFACSRNISRFPIAPDDLTRTDVETVIVSGISGDSNGLSSNFGEEESIKITSNIVPLYRMYFYLFYLYFLLYSFANFILRFKSNDLIKSNTL
jgi:hypothetical protein